MSNGASGADFFRGKKQMFPVLSPSVKPAATACVCSVAEKGARSSIFSGCGVTRRMGIMTERRTARRYDLSLPLIIRVAAERVSDTQKGKTRDISTRGVYFVLDQDMEAGSELDITLTLPGEITHGAEVFVHALGKVVRVERRTEDGNTRMGVAAVIERYDIIRGEDEHS
jgi:PilZ domain